MQVRRKDFIFHSVKSNLVMKIVPHLGFSKKYLLNRKKSPATIARATIVHICFKDTVWVLSLVKLISFFDFTVSTFSWKFMFYQDYIYHYSEAVIGGFLMKEVFLTSKMNVSFLSQYFYSLY